MLEVAKASECRCGHRIADHQTGEGMWAGFCYGGLTDPVNECKCESPENVDGTTVVTYTVRVQTADPRIIGVVEDAIRVAVDVMWDMADAEGHGMTEDELDTVIADTFVSVIDSHGEVIG